LLNHVSKYSGIAYKDDPAILAWETGNELDSPSSWTQEISQFIKSIDSNHLVLDGNYGVNLDSLDITKVDIYSDHFYPIDVSRVISDAQVVAAHNKTFLVGEYAWTSAGLIDFLQTIETQQVAGDTFWSLFGHLDTYGFEQHNDGFTVHYPGDNAVMETSVNLFRSHAYKMRNTTLPPPLIPGPPQITQLAPGEIAWRGVAGAGNYSVFQAANANGPFTTLCNQCATDNSTPLKIGVTSKSFYRVQGFSTNGEGGQYSPVAQCP